MVAVATALHRPLPIAPAPHTTHIVTPPIAVLLSTPPEAAATITVLAVATALHHHPHPIAPAPPTTPPATSPTASPPATTPKTLVTTLVHVTAIAPPSWQRKVRALATAVKQEQ